MASDDEDDLFDEEFDFVDDDDDDLDDESELDDESPLVDEEPVLERAAEDRREVRRDEPLFDRAVDRDGEVRNGDRPDDEPVDEYGRTEPAANYVVHVYEHQAFKRTIDRPFTPEDAESFITEFNRTGKSYGRVAVSGKNDAKPKKTLD